MSELASIFDLERGEHPVVISQRLAEVMRWCAHQRAEFRSLELICPYIDQAFDDSPVDFLDFQTTNKSVVEHVALKRRAHLAAIEPESIDVDGRWLCFEHGVSVLCGASEAETQGFFNEFDIPAWDTWVALVCFSEQLPTLLSWIPNSDVSVVDGGIAVNPVSCIYWLDDYPLPGSTVQIDLLMSIAYEAQTLLG